MYFMMIGKKYLFSAGVALLFTLAGCGQHQSGHKEPGLGSQPGGEEKGPAFMESAAAATARAAGLSVASFQLNIPVNGLALLDPSAPEITRITVSIRKKKHGNGDPDMLVYENHPVNVSLQAGGYISDPLSFAPGDYEIVFFEGGNGNDTVFSAPSENSANESLVKDALPIAFNVGKDGVTLVGVEVLRASSETISDFGYSSFGVSIVNSVDFLMAAFIYDPSLKNYQLTDATITISSGEKSLTRKLDPVTNRVRIPEQEIGAGPYHVTVSKDTYMAYTKDFTSADFIGSFTQPLQAVLRKQPQ
jgi:hypothetical protein